MTGNFPQVVLRERFDWIALDFVNTTVLTRSGTVDALETATQFFAWMERATPPGWRDLRPEGLPDRRTLHVEAVHLRMAMDRLLEARAARSSVDQATVHALQRAIGWARTSRDLEVGAHGTVAITTRYEAVHPAAALAPIVDDAIRLVAFADPARLRRCRADACLRWFVDTSKGGRRAWCSMTTCGNRAKATRYRARHERQGDAA
jgi:predicted RNA-binding Zn ribbon-like protein